MEHDDDDYGIEYKNSNTWIPTNDEKTIERKGDKFEVEHYILAN